jgi:Domain of unknown function (DUF397)
MSSMKTATIKGGVVDHSEENAVNLAVHGDIRWRHSSFCEGGACVEVAALSGETVGLRDARDPDGPVITIGRDAWRAFVARIKSGAIELI